MHFMEDERFNEYGKLAPKSKACLLYTSTQTLHSGNLYQIFTYVKNWSAAPDEVVSGMLLYAGTDDTIQPNNDYQMSGNQISVKTLDMDLSLIHISHGDFRLRKPSP